MKHDARSSLCERTLAGVIKEDGNVARSTSRTSKVGCLVICLLYLDLHLVRYIMSGYLATD